MCNRYLLLQLPCSIRPACRCRCYLSGDDSRCAVRKRSRARNIPRIAASTSALVRSSRIQAPAHTAASLRSSVLSIHPCPCWWLVAKRPHCPAAWIWIVRAQSSLTCISECNLDSDVSTPYRLTQLQHYRECFVSCMRIDIEITAEVDTSLL